MASYISDPVRLQSEVYANQGVKPAISTCKAAILKNSRKPKHSGQPPEKGSYDQTWQIAHGSMMKRGSEALLNAINKMLKGCKP